MTGGVGALRMPKSAMLRGCVGLLLAVFVVVGTAGTAGAVDINSPRYKPPSVAAGQLFGQDFCAEQGFTPGVGDMIWLTGKGGTQVVEINSGDQYANVTVQAAGRYCNGHNGATLVGGAYQSVLNGNVPDGRISGYIDYPQAGPGAGYYGYLLDQSLYVGGWGSGLHTVCLQVITNYPGYPFVPSPNACFQIDLVINAAPPTPPPATHQIYPGIINNGPSSIAPGQSASLRAFVYNNGTLPSVGGVPNTAYEFVVPSGQIVPDFTQIFTSTATMNDKTTVLRYLEGAPYDINGQAGCGWFKATYASLKDVLCKPVTDFDASSNYPTGMTDIATTVINADNYEAGDTICRFVAIRRFNVDHTADDPLRRLSAPTCVMVVKKPKVQIIGGDFRTRGKIVTGVTTSNSSGVAATFGSWVEYGAFSVGPTTGFASASALAKGSSTGPTDWNKLTFANTPSDGNFGSLPDLPLVAGQFVSKAATGTLPAVTSLSGRDGVYKPGDLTINASTIARGKSVIIVSSGKVTIAGDITYDTGPMSQLTDIPQVVIIAKNIQINAAVANVDAWLIATDPASSIDTCGDVYAFGKMPPNGQVLTDSVCNKFLVVHGPVVTSHLVLKRTGGAGSGADATDPAELFNLRPDTYMWAYLHSSQTGKVQTVSTTELAPRY